MEGLPVAVILRVVIIVLSCLQTDEVLELSKQIKEKLKEADQYGIVQLLLRELFCF